MREPELQSAVSKVKWRVLPLFVVMFIVNYIDRVNISFIKEQLGAELGIGDLAYGFGAGLFFWATPCWKSRPTSRSSASAPAAG